MVGIKYKIYPLLQVGSGSGDKVPIPAGKNIGSDRILTTAL